MTLRTGKYLALLLVMLLPAVVGAQAEEISWSAQASYEFGRTMWFELVVDAPQPVAQITLFLRAPEFANAFSVTEQITPASSLAVSQAVDLSQVRLAPFTTVTYWWVLETAVDSIELPENTIVYEDDQFDWRQVESDGLVVHWTGEEPGLGQLALDTVNASLPRLTGLIPVDDALTLSIYIYPSSADLRSALQLTGRDWVGAHAHPELGVILVTAVNARTAASDLRQSIPHELVHFLLYRATTANYDNVPAWFNEGLATFVETAPNPGYETLLATAVAEQRTIPFSELCQTFPPGEAQALLAYAQSASLVAYIQSRYGDQALREMIAAYADGADCQSGISRVLPTSLADLNREWLRQQKPRSPLAQFWLDNTIWMLLLAGGFGLIGLLMFNPLAVKRET